MFSDEDHFTLYLVPTVWIREVLLHTSLMVQCYAATYTNSIWDLLNMVVMKPPWILSIMHLRNMPWCSNYPTFLVGLPEMTNLAGFGVKFYVVRGLQ